VLLDLCVLDLPLDAPLLDLLLEASALASRLPPSGATVDVALLEQPASATIIACSVTARPSAHFMGISMGSATRALVPPHAALRDGSEMPRWTSPRGDC
jgi:hypothetical protein